MEDHTKFGKKVFIRNTGKDEYWLQNIIYDNPSRLGLGNLIPVNKEKQQSNGGRLDILLKDPDDNNSMYYADADERRSDHVRNLIRARKAKAKKKKESYYKGFIKKSGHKTGDKLKPTR